MNEAEPLDSFVLMRAPRYLVNKHQEALKAQNPNLLGAYAPEVIFDNAVDYAFREIKEKWKKEDLLLQIDIRNRRIEEYKHENDEQRKQITYLNSQIAKLREAETALEKLKQCL